jgi:hypothetical protein
MADNTTLNAGSGGAVITTEDIAGVQYPRNKIVLGTHAIDDGNVSKTNPLPSYVPPSTITNISGTVTTGGTAQALSASNSVGRRFMVQNLDPVLDLYISDMGTAVATQPSIKIPAGALYESPYATTSALSILGSTTGQVWSGREWL